VLLAALGFGTEALPAFSHRFSPRTFTQPQLFACLVLKEALRLDYRAAAELLADCPDLRAAAGLRRAPHFTTLQKAADRLLVRPAAERLLAAAVRPCRCRGLVRRRVRLAAIDASGFESRHVSQYFLKPMGLHRWDGDGRRRYARHPKLAVACDCASHVVLACATARGPSPDDPHFAPLLAAAAAAARAGVRAVAADAGFDAEAAHVLARERLGIRAVNPPTRGRPTAKLPTGRWRRLMRRRFPAALYRQQWQVEAVFSAVKRWLGAALSARSARRQARQMRLRVLAYNAMILRRDLFYRAASSRFSPCPLRPAVP